MEGGGELSTTAKTGLEGTGLILPLNRHGNLKSASSDQKHTELLQNIKSSKIPAVIKYGASWCQVCSQILPKFCQLSNEFPKLAFIYADIDECPETTQQIRYTPTFQFFRDGERVDEMIGAGEERTPCQVQATVLQQNGEKVVAEETFQSKSVPDNEEKENNGAPLESSSTTTLERWAVKLEQSVNIALTDSVIQILDIFYRDRDYARFFVLETIARVPYFAFMSVLHLYETFGWWRRADYLQVHFAESWNEMHHLLIMEELGGNQLWFDRFLSQHIAVFYYFMTVFMYILSPRMAYHFSECVEGHAFSTYDKFIKKEGDNLKNLPAPEIAVKYYTEGDLYLFDEFQTARPFQSRRPKIENLYDVFINIRDDEAEHCKTMKACQTPGNLRSPHSITVDTVDNDTGCVGDKADCIGIVDCVKQSVISQVKEEQKQSA